MTFTCRPLLSLVAFFLVIAEINIAHSKSLETVKQKVEFLNYLRSTDTVTYNDFILRFSPFDFLENVNKASRDVGQVPLSEDVLSVEFIKSVSIDSNTVEKKTIFRAKKFE